MWERLWGYSTRHAEPTVDRIRSGRNRSALFGPLPSAFQQRSRPCSFSHSIHHTPAMQRLRSGRLGRKHPRHSQPVTEPTASEQCHLADTHSQLQCHLTSWPPDVLEYFIASITDAQQLCTLSLVCKATRTVVKSAHCPIILRLPCASPDTAAQQLAAEAVAGTRLRIQGAQPESAEQQRGRHRPPAHIAAQTVLSRLPPGALRRVTTVELRVRDNLRTLACRS